MSERAPGVSPGGKRISATKRKRLAALDQSFRASGSSQKQGGARSGGKSPQQQQQRQQQAGRAGGGGRRRSGNSAGGPAGSSAISGSPGLGSERQQQGQQPAEPAYSRLDEGIARGPAADALQLPRPEANTQVVTSLLERLMATNPRAFDARAAIGLKVQDRTLLLDNPVGQKQSQPGGGLRQPGGSRWTAQLASRSQQRKQGLYQLQAAELTYEAVQPLHRSWQQYVRELLALPSSAAAGPRGALAGAAGADLEARLYAADLHGCLIRVAATADRRYQGVRGIVVRDTAHTLQLVTPEDRLLVIPKKLCTWEFDAGRRRVVTLLGPGLVQRGALGGSSGSGTGGGAGAAGGHRHRTLRDAIRGQQRG